MSTVVLSIATAAPASTIPVASARGSPRSAQRTASATAANATAKPSGCTSAYVARNHTVCANANVQLPKIATSGTTSNSSASAVIVAAPHATDTAESALIRAATEPNGSRCVHTQPTTT